jgi:prepilin-type N-terminal cleavage/methylation domain-containing protein
VVLPGTGEPMRGWRWRVGSRLGSNRVGGSDDGFTLVEVMVAIVVIFIVMSATAVYIVESLRVTSLARQRQTAAQLINQTLEQVRALPFSTVQVGLDTYGSVDPTLTACASHGPTCDSNISYSNGIYYFTYDGQTQQLLTHSNSQAPPAPLAPHVFSSTLDHTTYSIGVYPTEYPGNANVVHLTVVATWTANMPGIVHETMSGETFVYSPTGCLSYGTHPFAAPCQPFFYATASAGSGWIRIVPQSGQTAVQGLNLTLAEIELPAVTADMQIEQVSRVITTASGSGAQLSGDSSATESPTVATAQTSDDPTTANLPTESATLSDSPTALSDTASGSPNSVTATPSAADTGAAVATVVPSTSCTDLVGTAQGTTAPCLSGNVNQQDTAALTMDLNAGSTDLGSPTLASVGPSSSRVFTTRAVTSGGTYCSSTSGDGCDDARVVRTLGTVTLGQLLPKLVNDNDTPPGWSPSVGLVQLTNYSDEETSESGINAAGPAVYQPCQVSGLTACASTPQLAYYNGSGYSTLSLTGQAATTTVNLPTVTATDPSVNGAALTVTETGTLNVGGTTTSTQTTCSTGCTASATAYAPLQGSIDYTVTYAGQTIAAFTIEINLGNAVATTTYKQAPSG